MAMIRVIYGKAGTGKTTSILGELALAVSKGIGGYILLVPEQYSHEAERELCKACGDSASLYAEVRSFTGLARNLFSEYGGREPEFIDKGGRFLCLYEAMELSSGKLNFYGSLNRKADRQELLLRLISRGSSSVLLFVWRNVCAQKSVFVPQCSVPPFTARSFPPAF